MWQSAIVNNAKRPARRRWSAAGRHPSRRDYTVAVASLLLVVLVASVALTRRHPDPFSVIVLASVGLAMPALWLAWAANRSGSLVSHLDVSQVADNLAVAVRYQWHSEAASRRLHDPYPLPVSWVGADDSLTGAPDSWAKMAATGTGKISPHPSGTRAVG